MKSPDLKGICKRTLYINHNCNSSGGCRFGKAMNITFSNRPLKGAIYIVQCRFQMENYPFKSLTFEKCFNLYYIMLFAYLMREITYSQTPFIQA